MILKITVQDDFGNSGVGYGDRVKRFHNTGTSCCTNRAGDGVVRCFWTESNILEGDGTGSSTGDVRANLDVAAAEDSECSTTVCDEGRVARYE